MPAYWALIWELLPLCRDAVGVFYNWALIGEVLPLCRDPVGVFYNPSLLGSHWGSITPLQRSTRCILQSQLTGLSLGNYYPSAEMQSVYSSISADWALNGEVLPLCRDPVGVFYNWALIGEVLLLCRDVVGVFYILSRLGSHWGSITPLQRCSRCILHSQPTGLSLGKYYPSAEM